jgi:hypothetical protein
MRGYDERRAITIPYLNTFALRWISSLHRGIQADVLRCITAGLVFLPDSLVRFRLRAMPVSGAVMAQGLAFFAQSSAGLPRKLLANGHGGRLMLNPW